MQPTLLAVVVADRDGTIRHWNDDAERLFGEPAGAVGAFGERAGDETAFSPVRPLPVR